MSQLTLQKRTGGELFCAFLGRILRTTSIQVPSLDSTGIDRAEAASQEFAEFDEGDVAKLEESYCEDLLSPSSLTAEM